MDSELPDYVYDPFIDGGSLVTRLLLRTDGEPSGSSVQRRDPFTGEVIETLECSDGEVAGALAADMGIEFWAQIFRFEDEVAVDPESNFSSGPTLLGENPRVPGLRIATS